MVYLDKRDRQSVSPRQSPKAPSARTSAVHASLSSDSIVKQQSPLPKDRDTSSPTPTDTKSKSTISPSGGEETTASPAFTSSTAVDVGASISNVRRLSNGFCKVF